MFHTSCFVLTITHTVSYFAHGHWSVQHFTLKRIKNPYSEFDYLFFFMNSVTQQTKSCRPLRLGCHEPHQNRFVDCIFKHIAWCVVCGLFTNYIMVCFMLAYVVVVIGSYRGQYMSIVVANCK